MTDFSGFVNLNKPKGWSSHDCVARLRRLLNTKKIGHSGTLDPLATGVLPIAVGRATRLIQYLPSGKAYRATVRFGVTTSTDDLEGDVLTRNSAEHLRAHDVEALLPQFIGTLSQTPPMFSAVQVDGKRLYDLARKGKQIEVPSREVEIRSLSIAAWREGDAPEMVLDVECGPGTYIRSLARDIGAAVGTGATLAGLERTQSNGFEIGESLTLERIEQAIAAQESTFRLSSAAEAVQHLDAIALTSPLAKRWCMGQKLALNEPGISFEGVSFENSDLREAEMESVDLETAIAQMQTPFRILCDRTFLGIGEARLSDYGETADTKHAILVPKMVFTPA